MTKDDVERAIAAAGMTASRCVRTADDDSWVFFFLGRTDRYASVEALDDGKCVTMVSNRETGFVRATDVDGDSITGALEQIRRFMDSAPPTRGRT